MPVQSKKGFTLIELMVVISIIAILATIGLVTYTNSQITARDSRRKQDLQSLKTALELYYQKNGSYPQSTPNVDDSYTTEACQSNLHIISGTTHGDPSQPWIACNIGVLSIPTYINTFPVDPQADKGNPMNTNVTGYAYWSGAIQCTGSPSQVSGQYYILAAGLENASDSSSNQNKTYKDCRGVQITTNPNAYILTSQ